MMNTASKRSGSARDIGAGFTRHGIAACGLLALVMSASCKTAEGPSFPAHPTDSGSRYSDFSLPGSDTEMQNTDLED